ncbi:MAG: HAD family hydrolase [Ignavibacteriales bacterium]
MHKTYNIILFDLDGTLVDPKLGITQCVQYALKSFDIDEPELNNLCKFIGPPLKESFIEFYGFDEKSAFQAVEKYRERYSDIGIFEAELYPGIAQLLEQLCTAGKRLAVATSKPTIFASRVLEHFDVAHYFEYVSGSELDNTRTKKSEVIEHGLKQLQVVDTACALMIGDREYDIKGAKTTGLTSVGVLYGYGSFAELKNAGADYIVQDIMELEKVLLPRSDKY